MRIKQLLVIFICIYGTVQAVQHSVDYLFVAPKHLITNTDSVFCLSIYNFSTEQTTSTANFVISVHVDDDKPGPPLVATNQDVVKDGDYCVNLTLPPTSETSARIDLKITFNNGLDPINTTKTIEIQNDKYLTFVESDKAVYKPGQTVKFRMLVVNHEDLTPVDDMMISTVYIENPSGIRLAQWLNTSLEFGFAQLEFDLSSEPQLGEWKINVVRTPTSNPIIRRFKIEKYVLPRFEVQIEHESNVLQDAPFFEWNICGKYSYGKPVTGSLHVEIESYYYNYHWYGNDKQEKENPLIYNVPIDGCYKLRVTDDELKTNKQSKRHIKVTASLEETGTNKIENKTIEQNILDRALDISVTSTNKYQGLPQYFKISVVNNTNKIPVQNEPIEICSSSNYNDENNTCFTRQTDEHGLIEFLGLSDQDNVNIKAKAVNYPETNFPSQNDNTTDKYYYPQHKMEQPIGYHNVYNFINTGNKNAFVIFQKGSDDKVNCQSTQKLYVLLTVNASDSTVQVPTKFNYLVQSRGKLRYNKQIEPKLEAITDKADYEKIFGLPVVELRPIDNTTDFKVFTFQIDLEITDDMSPVASVLVYYTRPEDRQILADQKQIQIQHCLKNKVKAEWTSSQLYPGDKAKLHIKTQSKSMCSISAVDKSTSFLGESSKVTTNDIFDALNKYKLDGSTQPSTYSYCDDAQKAFNEFGFIVETNLTLSAEDCNHRVLYGVPYSLIGRRRGYHFRSMVAAPTFVATTQQPAVLSTTMSMKQPRITSKPIVTKRTYFPESWLWNLLPTNEKGDAQFSSVLPDSITDWITTVTCISKTNGIGVANPTQIRAFQPFFLDYALPYSIKRGEILHLKVLFFNYMPESLPIKITLHDSEALTLVGENKQESVSMCVDSHGNIVHTFLVKASKLGNVNLTVTGQVDTNYKGPGDCNLNNEIKHRDTIVKPILVEPEGYPVEIAKSTYICPKDLLNETTPSGVQTKWEFKLPEDYVEGSERAKISAIGEILGPALQNLDRLVQVPVGCGEQNMILFTPNLHVLNYLEQVNIQNDKLKRNAKKNMKIGYEREQNYRHKNGAFSAFGESEEGSLWLTAFVVRSFAKARFHIFVDETKIQQSIDWITEKQMKDGCFQTVGMVHHKELLGGLQRSDSNGALTAYIIAAIVETGLPINPSVVDQAKHCLAVSTISVNDTYALALKAYAYAQLGLDNDVKPLIEQLIAKAKTEEGNLVYWANEGSSALELNIEMTSYVILTLLKANVKDHDDLLYNAIRWLSAHRNENGGFVSTQDTILALEALATYAGTLNSGKTNLNIKIEANNFNKDLSITEDDKLVLKEVKLPELPTPVTISTNGDGCALLQGIFAYNIHSAENSSSFGLDIHIDSTKSDCKIQDLKVCTWYIPQSQSSNMALLEINMPTGYEPVESTLDNLLNQHSSIKRFENEKKKVNIYFSELLNERVCVQFQIEEHIVVEKRQPANVKVFDYYDQKLQESANYKLEETCHQKDIPHNEPGLPVPLPISARQERSILPQ